MTDSSSCEPLSAGSTLTERGVRAISLASGASNVKPGPLTVCSATGSADLGRAARAASAAAHGHGGDSGRKRERNKAVIVGGTLAGNDKETG